MYTFENKEVLFIMPIILGFSVLKPKHFLYKEPTLISCKAVSDVKSHLQNKVCDCFVKHFEGGIND